MIASMHLFTSSYIFFLSGAAVDFLRLLTVAIWCPPAAAIWLRVMRAELGGCPPGSWMLNRSWGQTKTSKLAHQLILEPVAVMCVGSKKLKNISHPWQLKVCNNGVKKLPSISIGLTGKGDFLVSYVISEKYDKEFKVWLI